MCTSLGQPVYRKIGFSDAGRVTALKTTVSAAGAIDAAASDSSESLRYETYGSLDRTNSDSPPAVDSEILDNVASLDARATGWNRKRRLQTMLQPRSGSDLRSMAAIATNQHHEIIGATILRQEGPGSPLVVGPLVGAERAALHLVAVLARAVPEDIDASTPLSLLVSDHPALVEEFTSAGFSVAFDFPAMSLDGEPIYQHGDGSYLSLIHPTLG